VSETPYVRTHNMHRHKLMDDRPKACFCVGPQNGDPVCPCRMKSVVIEDGHYVQKVDLGPVPDDVRRRLTDG